MFDQSLDPLSFSISFFSGKFDLAETTTGAVARRHAQLGNRWSEAIWIRTYISLPTPVSTRILSQPTGTHWQALLGTTSPPFGNQSLGRALHQKPPRMLLVPLLSLPLASPLTPHYQLLKKAPEQYRMLGLRMDR